MSQYDDNVQENVKRGLLLKASIREQNEQIFKALGYATQEQTSMLSESNEPLKPGDVIRRRKVYVYNADEEARRAKPWYSRTHYHSNSLMWEYRRVQKMKFPGNKIVLPK